MKVRCPFTCNNAFEETQMKLKMLCEFKCGVFPRLCFKPFILCSPEKALLHVINSLLSYMLAVQLLA